MTDPTTGEPRMHRRTALKLLLGGGSAALTGCAGGFLGYTTQPNYDPSIATVYVPVFRTAVFETTPYRGIEMQVTREVIDAIESKTPMKVLSHPDEADTELQGNVVGLYKQLVNRTPYNEVREMSLFLAVQIVWHDLRPGNEGKVLTNPKGRRVGEPLEAIPFDLRASIPKVAPELPQPVTITTVGRGVIELGETNTSALAMAVRRMGTQVVNAMEEPW